MRPTSLTIIVCAFLFCVRVMCESSIDHLNISDLNLMDWSGSNIVTVALGKIIYLWNAGTGNIEELREYENGDHACSLAWIQEGNIVAIGGNDGTVELWDCEAKKRYDFIFVISFSTFLCFKCFLFLFFGYTKDYG